MATRRVTRTGIVLELGPNSAREPGRVHQELHAPCGCAFHQKPALHWHPCRLHAAAGGLLAGLESAAKRMETALSDIRRGDRIDASAQCFYGALNARKLSAKVRNLPAFAKATAAQALNARKLKAAR